MKKVALAIVGTGNIAQTVHLPILRRMPNVELRAVYDRNYSKARAVAERFGIPTVLRSLEELRNLPLDAVDICSSSDSHLEVALASIEAGLHLLVERPLALTAAEAAVITEAARQRSVKLMVGMNHRFRTDVVLMKNYIEQEQLGHVYYAKAGWLKPFTGDTRLHSLAERQGRGVLLELGLVMVDLVLYLFRTRSVRSVTASLFYNLNPAIEDVAIATLNFSDGSIASVEASWSLVRPEDLFYCNVYGKRGSAFINPFKVVQQNGGTPTVSASGPQQSKAEAYAKSYQAELKHFIAAVEGLVPVVSTGEEAVERLRVIEALYQSAAEQREILIDSNSAVAA